MIFYICAILFFFSTPTFAEFDYSAEIGTKLRLFEDDEKSYSNDYQLDLKSKLQADYEVDQYRLHIGFFARVDQNDSQRNIINFDELYLLRTFNNFSVNVGNNIFNWSVMEIFHPVDTINSKNFDSNGDLAERLGQSSLILKYEFENSFFEGILFISSQKSIMPGESNRNGALIEFRNPKFVNGNKDVSSRSDMLQYVLRYQHSFDFADIDFHYARKYDTNNPLISSPVTKNTSPTIEQLEITPYFMRMQQYGLTVQANYDAYLLKIEHAHFDYDDDSVDLFIPPISLIENSKEDFSLTAIGLERTFTYKNDHEGTLFIEYQTILGTTIEEARILSPFQRDMAIGYRHNYNDFNGNETVAFIISDVDHGEERIYSLSHSFRLWSDWKFEGGIRIIEAQNPSSTLSLSNFEGLRSIANGDSLNIELTRFF